jgi:hypothetical protein
MTDLGGGKNTPPCFKCGKEMQRVTDGGWELQPEDGLHFEALGAYGSTVFDPMDGSSLNIIICDDCITEGARQGLVMLDQKYVGISVGDPIRPDSEIMADFACGYYSPEREAVPWDPDKEYEDQEPLRVDWEDVATAKALHSTVMWKASAVEYAREQLIQEAKEEAENDLEGPS